MIGEQEIFFQCPYCLERISMLVELYYGEQSYIEDCEVCCRPIELRYQCDQQSVTSVIADRAQ